MSGVASTDTVSVTVYGPVGSLDLAVPAGAAAADVLREYANQTGHRAPLQLSTTRGRQLPHDRSLAAAGVEAGALLVALGLATPTRRAAPTEQVRLDDDRPTTSPVHLFVAIAAGLIGVLAAVLVAGSESTEQRITVVVLSAAALLGVVPVGQHQAQRAAGAPLFAAAGTFALVYEPGAVHLPVTVGVSALVAAVAAGVARALDTGRREVAEVWMAAGLVCFALTAFTTLTGASAAAHWAILLLATLLACRFVPMLAVDVPDQLLVDLERLAITAWSARDVRPQKRRRTVVAPRMVEDLLATGAIVVNTAGLLIAAVAGIAAPALLATATLGVDDIGAAALVFFVGGGLLLAARNLRHAMARAALRWAGIYCWAVLSWHLITDASVQARWWGIGAATVIGLALVAAAIATGRGWRSVRWARRAEIGEVLCGAFAIGALMVASGAFRVLWEMQT
ncbi:EsaB/YukD family protein [Nocardioides sp. Bht2]|uniref:EsaB/YukD family protein n=1 Tax=Nocardioides sp. Bht2 TaxID=3392297 RepID=UPI0039B58825